MSDLVDRLAGTASLVIDGGLATTLEARGHDLDDPLWSARLLIEDPDAIAAVHREFLAAGADVVIAASYQASLTGFGVRGLDEAEGERLLRLSVDLALDARDAFWADPGRPTERRQPLVAASVGPYGAYLADGSEFVGRYGLDDAGLRGFHEPRWRILADTPADLLACETIPSAREAKVLLELFGETPSAEGWLSFSCYDGRHLCDGTEMVEMARLCDAVPRIVAVGVNCTAPRHVASLIREIRRGTDKPVVVYPNRGELYDPVHKTWHEDREAADWDRMVAVWLDQKVGGIGGCCRVGPDLIAAIRRLVDRPAA